MRILATQGRGHKQKFREKLVPITPVFPYYMEPVFGLSMGKIGEGGTEKSYYGNQLILQKRVIGYALYYKAK